MSDRKEPSGMLKRLSEASWVEPLLGAMVAIFGLLTAYAAYQAGIYGGNSAEAYFVALGDLTDANAEYAYRDQTATQDANLVLEWDIQNEQGASEELLDIILSNMSPMGLAALDRSDDLDNQYYEELYGWANALVENSDAAFKAAQDWDSQGDAYELLVLILALGLGFSGWASLMSSQSWTRYVFAMLGVIALVVSIVYTVDLESQETPASVKTLWENEELYDQVNPDVLYNIEE
jgi:hypothetical protein